MKKAFSIAASVILLVVIPVCIFAATTVIYPTADSYVLTFYPDENYGSQTTMGASNVDSIGRYPYIKFSSSDIPAGDIISATLHLFVTGCGMSPTAAIENCATDWQEEIITYENKPGVIDPFSNVRFYDGTKYTYYDMDITQLVRAWQTGPNYGLRFELTSQGYLYFSTKESTSDRIPYLEIIYTAWPTQTCTQTFDPLASITNTYTITPTATLTPICTPTLTVTPNWMLGTTNTAMPQRSIGAGLVYNNRMWMIGGISGVSSSLNDVWSSTNGVDWTCVTGNAQFTRRYHHAACVFENRMWVIGGTTGGNEVWYSQDGEYWTQAVKNAEFSSRFGLSAVEYKNKIWVIGGSYKRDVWTSEDGIGWYQVNGYAPFHGRISHASIVFNGKLWVIGGYDGSSLMNDVWYTEDGVTWTCTTLSAPFAPRMEHQCVVYGNRIWLTGGFSSPSGFSTFNDVWSSGDGVTWIKESVYPFSVGRGAHVALNYNNIIYAIHDHMSLLREVWYWPATPMITNTITPVVTITLTKTNSPTKTITQTHTHSPTTTATPTVTETRTNTATRTITATWSISPTFSVTSTITETSTPSLDLAEAVDDMTWNWFTSGSGLWTGENTVFFNDNDAAQSPPINDQESSYLDAQVVGPGAISFYWSVSSEPNYDYLGFYIDGVRKATISGSVDWTQKTYNMGSGTHSLRWAYIKSYMNSRGMDCGWVDKFEFTYHSPTITPTFTETPTTTPTSTVTWTPGPSLNEALDNYDLTFTYHCFSCHETLLWRGETTDYFFDNDALQTDSFTGSDTSIRTIVNGPGRLTFYWSKGTSYGYVRLLDNNYTQIVLNSASGWQMETYDVTSGAHTMIWNYVNNSGITDGCDCARLDYVQYTYMTPTVTKTVSPTITASFSRTASPTKTPTFTITPTRTVSFTVTETLTGTPTYTCTPFVTGTVSVSPTITKTSTVTPTATERQPYPDALKNDIYVYPQPANRKVRFVYSAQKEGAASVAIYDISGRLVAKENGAAVVSDTNYIDLDASKLPAGLYVYTFTVISGEEKKNYGVRPFVVIRK